MARQIYEVSPIGVGAVASGSGLQNTNNYSGPSGDQGKGWTFQGSWTNTQFTAQTPTIRIPSNARDMSVTYSYTGAGTVTFNLTGSNDLLSPVAAGTAIFGNIAATFAPQILVSGGTAATAVIPAPPLFLSGTIGGSGATGTDVITITLSCNTVIRP